MNTIIENSPLLVGLLLLAVVIGIAIGLAVVGLTIIFSQPRSTKKPAECLPPRRLVSTRRHRRESADRAAARALVSVAGLAMEGPERAVK